jgi:hypothetical protein
MHHHPDYSALPSAPSTPAQEPRVLELGKNYRKNKKLPTGGRFFIEGNERIVTAVSVSAKPAGIQAEPAPSRDFLRDSHSSKARS